MGSHRIGRLFLVDYISSSLAVCALNISPEVVYFALLASSSEQSDFHLCTIYICVISEQTCSIRCVSVQTVIDNSVDITESWKSDGLGQVAF